MKKKYPKASAPKAYGRYFIRLDVPCSLSSVFFCGSSPRFGESVLGLGASGVGGGLGGVTCGDAGDAGVVVTGIGVLGFLVAGADVLMMLPPAPLV